MPAQQAIERRGVQLSQRIVGRIRKIDNDEVPEAWVAVEPGECVIGNDVDPRRPEGIAVQGCQQGMFAKHPRHLGIQVH